MVGFLVALLISVAISVVSYLIAPKPKIAKPEAAKEMEDPVAEAGMEIPVLFGTLTKTQPNILWFGDKSLRTYKIDAGGGKK